MDIPVAGRRPGASTTPGVLVANSRISEEARQKVMVRGQLKRYMEREEPL